MDMEDGDTQVAGDGEAVVTVKEKSTKTHSSPEKITKLTRDVDLKDLVVVVQDLVDLVDQDLVDGVAQDLADSAAQDLADGVAQDLADGATVQELTEDLEGMDQVSVVGLDTGQATLSQRSHRKT